MRRIAFIFLCLVMSAKLAAGDCGCGMKPRIIDGTEVPESTFPTVGIISDAPGTFICSGTLIAPHFVLCAAHCAVDGNTGQIAMAQTDGRFILGGVTYNSVHIYSNSTYKGDVSQEQEGAIDLSIFELDTDVPGVTPSLLYRQTPTVGTLLTLVGYGETGTGAKGTSGNLPPDGTIVFGHTPIDVVTGTFIKWNFDNVPPPNQESNTAPGDSGGPQFITVDGVMYVASVTSGGNKNNAGFGDFSYNTRVDVAADWIDSIVGGQTATGNHAPTIQSLNANPSPAQAGDTVTLTTAAADADGDVLNFHWFFGDGSDDSKGTPSETHTYVADGTYTVQIVVTDGKGGSAAQSLTLTVGAGGSAGGFSDALVTKRKFTLNFKTQRSSMDFTLFHEDFLFFSKFEFLAATDDAKVSVLLGSTQIDSFTLFNGKGSGLGLLTFNYRAGTVRYQLRNNASLSEWLKPFGAVNADVIKTVTVPLRINIGGTVYGNNTTFFYTGKQGKTGSGK